MEPEPTIGEALEDAQRLLGKAGIEAPRMQASALLCHVTGLDRAAQVARLREPLPPAAQTELRRLIARRAAHTPLQYLLGRASFLDFEVRVGDGVFIPRPETEQVVQAALALWDPAHPWAVDLCTGSGVIAIALARARPSARIIAVDLSPPALVLASRSATDLGVQDRIDFVRGDLLTAFRGTASASDRLGVVVCNPPYAAAGTVTQPEVHEHEPALAWAAGPTGTEAYARLVPQAAALLRTGRPLVLELGFDQGTSVPKLLAADANWTTVRIEPDFQGLPRVLSARRR